MKVSMVSAVFDWASNNGMSINLILTAQEVNFLALGKTRSSIPPDLEENILDGVIAGAITMRVGA